MTGFGVLALEGLAEVSLMLIEARLLYPSICSAF